jgi:hypothetical protein
MNRTTRRRFTAAGLLAGAVLGIAVAAKPPWASAESSDAGEAMASEDAAQCGTSDAVSADAAIAQIQQDLLAAQPGEPEADDGSGYVVLNNRGYNYGPPPGVRIDSMPPELESKTSEGAR